MRNRPPLPVALSRFSLIASLLFAASCSAPSPEPEPAAFQETPEQKEQRMAWYKEAKFGMFIHWGPYSALAGEWNGKQVEVGDIAEWIMQRLQIPRDEYREMTKNFNPVEFDAEGIVRLAKDAGMRYLIFTSKHHDGFAMYHSKISKYNIIDWTPYESDPLRELAEECRMEGIRFGFYYSHREDWDEPFAYGNTWDFDFDPEQDLDTFEEKYLETKAKPQLRELLTDYGCRSSTIGSRRKRRVWRFCSGFGGGTRMVRSRHLYAGSGARFRSDRAGPSATMHYQRANRQLRQGALGRLPKPERQWHDAPRLLPRHRGVLGDPSDPQPHMWGSASSIPNGSRPPRWFAAWWSSIVSKGGNYLLNIGPDGLGRVPQESVDTLTGVGKWVRANGESIYGTTASPFPEIPWGYSTVKGGTLYLHVFEWPKDGLLQLKGLRNEVIKVATLADPEQALSFKQEAGFVEIKVPAKPPDPINSVLVMEIEGTADVDPVLVTQREDGGYALDFLSAATQGAAVKRFNREGEWHISKWTGPSDGITWHIDVASPGEFEVRITYAANEGWVGQGYAIEAGGTQLEAKVERTGDWYEYQTFSPGTIALAEAGQQTIRIVPKSTVPESLMYFKEMELVPAAQ